MRPKARPQCACARTVILNLRDAKTGDHSVLHARPTTVENQLDGLDSEVISSIELFLLNRQDCCC